LVTVIAKSNSHLLRLINKLFLHSILAAAARRSRTMKNAANRKATPPNVAIIGDNNKALRNAIHLTSVTSDRFRK
jgi:hypothetical protein